MSGSGGGGIHLNTLVKKGFNANKSRRSDKWPSVIFRPFGSSMIGSLLFTCLSTHTIASIRHNTMPWNLLPFREVRLDTLAYKENGYPKNHDSSLHNSCPNSGVCHQPAFDR